MIRLISSQINRFLTSLQKECEQTSQKLNQCLVQALSQRVSFSPRAGRGLFNPESAKGCEVVSISELYADFKNPFLTNIGWWVTSQFHFEEGYPKISLSTLTHWPLHYFMKNIYSITRGYTHPIIPLVRYQMKDNAILHQCLSSMMSFSLTCGGKIVFKRYTLPNRFGAWKYTVVFTHLFLAQRDISSKS